MTECECLKRRILLTFVCSVQNFVSVGLIYGFSVMYADLINVFSTSRFNSALIQGTLNVIGIGGGVLWTLPVKRFGIGLCMVVGALLGCLGFVTSLFARNFQTIIVCTGVITGTGISIGFLAPCVVVGMIYNEDPGFQMALLTVSGSLGQMTIPLVYEAFLTYYHWSGAFVLLASIALHGVPCGLLIYYSSNLLVSKDDKDVSYSSDACAKEQLTDPVIWLFIVILLIIFGTVNFEPWFLVDQMVSLGYSQQFATQLLSVFGFANLVGRIVGSVLRLSCRSFPAICNMFYVCPLIALGHTLVMKLQTFNNWMIAACIVHGFGYGNLAAITPVVLYDLVERDKFLEAFALLGLAIGTANLLCNFVGGSIRDIYGTYDFAYELGIAAALLATFGFLVLACVTRKCHRKESILQQNYLKTKPYKSIH